MHKQIQEIRRKLYLLRDGASSASMREKGVDYKLNFGVPGGKLKELASEYAPDPELTEQLWQENTRELKLLALMIQEPSEFKNADNWVQSINNVELAEQSALHLFSKIPEASSKAAQWIQSNNLYTRITGFRVYMRLFMSSYSLEGEAYDRYFRALFEALNNDSALLRSAALNSLKHFGKQSLLRAKNVLAECKETERLPEEVKSRLIQNLEFEFDYYA